MKLLDNGNVCMDEADLEAMKIRYFADMHTPDYANIVGITIADGNQIGFFGWLDNMEFYVGDERIMIRSQNQLDAALAMMDAIKTFQFSY